MPQSTRRRPRHGFRLACLILLPFAGGLGLGAGLTHQLGDRGWSWPLPDPAPTGIAAADVDAAIALASQAAIEPMLAPLPPIAEAPPLELVAAEIGPDLDADEDAGEPAAEQVVVRRGDTLLDILTRLGIPQEEAHDAVSSLRTVYDPRRLQAGQTLAVELARLKSPDAAPSRDGVRLAALSLDLDILNGIRLQRDDEGAFAASTVLRELKRERLGVAGTIQNSLYADAVAAGMPQPTIAQIVKLFSWDVDFQRDIQPGDGFAAVFERQSTEAGLDAGAAQLLFARLALGDRTVDAYRFELPDGGSAWYDRQGQSLRKALLRTPIDGARLSSRFGSRRHPVLGYTRMHKGVDFAAPSGTPIFAAGDGRIEMIGKNKGYGNYVRIRHDQEYATAYGHMSRFVRGMRKGDRVSQGDIVGYVGATGLATGPHLHYEILQKGQQVNPLGVKPVIVDRLGGDELKRFQRVVAEIDRLQEELGDQQLVAERQP